MCGIFGVFGAKKAAELAVIGLHGIQHRAIDFAGITTTDGVNFYRHVGTGLARQVFSNEQALNRLHGRHALGHIRYPTAKRQADEELRDNTQPISGHWNGVPFALAHNGNLTNVAQLHALLGHRPLATTMDSELIVRLIEKKAGNDLWDDLAEVFALLRGSYTLGILFPDKLVAVVDPSGNRPLSLARKDDSRFISSETCSFGSLGASHVSDIEPGTMLEINTDGTYSHPYATPSLKKCRFEGNYFSHPASLTFSEPVSDYRKRVGRALAEYCPAPGADIVAPVPDSARFIAMGYAESGASGSYDEVIIRSHYVGRTFIAADQAKRDAAVAQKFSFAAHAIQGKSIVVVDDSIVRGTTLIPIIAELRRCGAKQVHVRIGTPPIKHPCLYGINTPQEDELISARYTQEQVRLKIGADSLLFLPLEVQKDLSPNGKDFCYACMNADYWH